MSRIYSGVTDFHQSQTPQVQLCEIVSNTDIESHVKHDTNLNVEISIVKDLK